VIAPALYVFLDPEIFELLRLLAVPTMLFFLKAVWLIAPKMFLEVVLL
jgi:hypothetical protein